MIMIIVGTIMMIGGAIATVTGYTSLTAIQLDSIYGLFEIGLVVFFIGLVLLLVGLVKLNKSKK